MQDERQHTLAFRVLQVVLHGPGPAFHHRIHGFQMAGIGGKADMEFFTVHMACGGVTEVVFDVAPADGGFRQVVRREFAEDGFSGLWRILASTFSLPRWAMPISM